MVVFLGRDRIVIQEVEVMDVSMWERDPLTYKKLLSRDVDVCRPFFSHPTTGGETHENKVHEPGHRERGASMPCSTIMVGCTTPLRISFQLLFVHEQIWMAKCSG